MVDAHLERVRAHFGRTADTYARLMQVRGAGAQVRLDRVGTVVVLLALCVAGCSSGREKGVNAGGGGGALPIVATGGYTASTGGLGASAGGTLVATGTGGGSGGTQGSRGGNGGAVNGGAANGGDAAADSGVDSGTQRGTVGDWAAGDYPPTLADQTYLELTGVKGQGTYTRQYKVHVPPGYDSRVPTPVVFCIHGLSQNAVMFCVTGAAMDKKSDSAGFIMVMPNGYQNSWNAGTCCGGASNEKLDDVSLFRAMLAEVEKHLNVDRRRVYATGLSNGAYMSYRLACEASDLFAAIAPGAGAVGINSIGGGTNAASDFTVCNPTEHVSVLDIHGTSDPLIAYSLQAPSLELFSASDGCSSSTLPASSPKSAGDTTCVSYSGCPSGLQVIGCSIAGGGHCWFGSPDCGTGGGAIGAAFVGANSNAMINNDALWDFFKAHSK